MTGDREQGGQHAIVLEGLRTLYQSMKASRELRVQFEHRHRNNGAKFVVVFLADSSPFELMVVAKGLKPLAFVVQVLPGFRVRPWIADGKITIAKLKEILGVTSGGQRPFSLTNFLKEIDTSAPTHVSGVIRAQPEVLARYHRDVEEADKVYFERFLPHNGINSNATEPNLDKTRRLLGEEIYRACRDRNISSCWTTDPAQQKPWNLRKLLDRRDGEDPPTGR